MTAESDLDEIPGGGISLRAGLFGWRPPARGGERGEVSNETTR